MSIAQNSSSPADETDVAASLLMTGYRTLAHAILTGSHCCVRIVGSMTPVVPLLQCIIKSSFARLTSENGIVC